ncbi:MAG: hypothetical protein HY367_02385 [Candidatus Aenigmarchaeota archaeon]|nr:hypothetical protein [Candidatus Aenigmarchaeota archaeon]
MPADKLLEAYEKFLSETFLNYRFAEGLLKPLDFTASDARQFCFFLEKYADHQWFKQTGYFISALANRVLEKEREMRLGLGKLGAKMDFIGNRLSRGRLVVEGDVGDHAGLEMFGGDFEVTGSAGNYLGDSMIGGRIAVHGSAGDFAGVEMKGGQIAIAGSAGKCLARTMRNGMITVGGDAGEYACWFMAAGLVTVKGSAGLNAGQSMAGGELRVMGEIKGISPYFQRGRIFNKGKLVMAK